LRILLVNDDGIASEGIEALVKVLAVKHEIIVAAPASEQSGMSHALTVRKKLLVESYAFTETARLVEAWKISGTPTDCVKLYLDAMAGDKKPELVISGINRGANLGSDVLYSGTVGAAMEGYFHGISSIAISREAEAKIDYVEIASWLEEYIQLFGRKESQPYFLNINFPREFRDNAAAEFVFTALGHRDYVNAFKRSVDAEGKVSYFISGEMLDFDNSEGTDVFAVKNGYVSITPLQLDLTDYSRLHVHRSPLDDAGGFKL
jgi:5'-nucleotidase